MKYSYKTHEKSKPSLVRHIRRLALLALVFIMFYTLFMFIGGRPQVSEESLKALSLIPAEKTYQIILDKPVREIRLYAQQGQEKREIYVAKLSSPSKEFSFKLRARDTGLKDGEAVITLEVSSGFLSKRSYSVKAVVDTVPPKLSLISHTSMPSLGGSCAIKVKVDEEAQVSILQGNNGYSLYPMGGGYYAGLFPIRLDSPNPASLTVVATDKAGNSSSLSINLKVKPTKFREDRINIEDGFIKGVIYPLLGEEGKGLSPLEAFKRVNEEWRAKDIKSVEQIGKKSEPRVLWEGAFLQLPNSKVFATYGDIRHYYYEGQKVSESRHMGFDFASVERAEVPAGNSGVVVFTGQLGIYGNTVIIDHGLGLMSLYGHLSEIRVKEGQFVRKGEIIGRTGTSGLALGDHLHFGILLQGYEVNPIEWLDPKWIKNNVDSVLKAK